MYLSIYACVCIYISIWICVCEKVTRTQNKKNGKTAAREVIVVLFSSHLVNKEAVKL